MVREKYGVRLTAEQRNQLQHLVRAGKGTARVTVRARILLKTDEGWSAPQVGPSPGCGRGHGVSDQAALRRRGAGRGAAKTGPKPIGTGSWTTGAKPTSSLWPAPEPPEGHEHWTLRLLAGQVVELGLAPSLSHETVRLHLKKHPSSRGRSRSGASPR